MDISCFKRPVVNKTHVSSHDKISLVLKTRRAVKFCSESLHRMHFIKKYDLYNCSEGKRDNF